MQKELIFIIHKKVVQLDYPGNGFKSTSILAQDRISADGPALGGDGRDSLR